MDRIEKHRKLIDIDKDDINILYSLSACHGYKSIKGFVEGLINKEIEVFKKQGVSFYTPRFKKHKNEGNRR